MGYRRYQPYRTRPDGSHYLRSSAQLTGVDFDNSEIRFIGTADIDLEAVAAAKPDLIITEPSRHVSVEQLAKIAPTVSIDHLQGSAPRIYRKLAQLTGSQARLAVLERRYQEQIKQLKATVDPQQYRVSVIQANNGKVTVHYSYHALGRVLRDAGFRFPPLIDKIPDTSGLTSAPSSYRSWMPILSSRPGVRTPAVSRRMS